MMERILRVHKAEAVGADLDIKRSRIYDLAAHPEQISLGKLAGLLEHDPDPETGLRIAAHLSAHASVRALIRKRAGAAVLILGEIGAHVQADEESVRRATGRGDLGDD